jgi:DNA-directed RNA polymerase subunit RPC12/RpoP
MTETVRYTCERCGDRFEVQVLTERERRKASEERRPVYAIQCPRCGSRNVRRS